jgi:virginiamycin B lyase
MWFSADIDSVGWIGEDGTGVTLYTLPGQREANYLVEGPDGNIWFTSLLGVDAPAWDDIGRITPSGTISLFRIPTFNAVPESLVGGPDWSIWFGEHAEAGKIGRITTSGKITQFRFPGGSAGAITAGPAGRCGSWTAPTTRSGT